MHTHRSDKLFLERRQTLMNQMPEGVAVIFSAKELIRSHDTEFPFRQDSHFYYLTGINEPDSILLLDNREQKNTSTLFVRKRDPKMEMWTGKRPGPEGILKSYSFDKSHTIEEAPEILEEVLKNASHVMVDFFAKKNHTHLCVIEIIEKLSKAKKANYHSPSHLVHLPPLIEKMRLIKGQEEIETLKKSLHISALAHKASMSMAKPGIFEYQIQAVMEFIFKYHKAQSAAYGPIIAGGDNANILHYITNREELKAHELLLIDCGAELDLMASDITRTFPISGKFNSTQKDLYQMVLDSQLKVIKEAKVGMTLPKLHELAIASLSQGMLDCGLLKGSLDEVISNKLYQKYYPHGTCHWLGLDVHDQCPYKDHELKDITLAPGMIFTVEPGLYIGQLDEEAPEHMRGIGIRIEDNILITKEGPINLSFEIEKTVDEVEKACQIEFKMENYL